MYTNIEQAILFMMKANKGLRLKTENVSRSFHNISVYEMMKSLTSTEDILIAAILHDIIHYTEYGYDEIEERFGTLVADMVLELSEDMSITKWFPRKKEYINRMRKLQNIDLVNIMLADKLQILMTFYNNFLKMGDKVWKLTGGSKYENAFVYREVYNIAYKNKANPVLLERYKELVTLYFGDVDV